VTSHVWTRRDSHAVTNFDILVTVRVTIHLVTSQDQSYNVLVTASHDTARHILTPLCITKKPIISQFLELKVSLTNKYKCKIKKKTIYFLQENTNLTFSPISFICTVFDLKKYIF
jgi:DUF1365 family protein